MGGTRKQGDAKRPPRGITIREHANVKSIQIEFAYKGVRCRESLRLEPTAANIKYAEGLRVEIARKITDGVFVYTEYFPESPKAVQFGHAPAKRTMGELLRSHLTGYEHAVANGQMSPSTLYGYRKVINGHLLPKFDKVLLRDLSPSMLREWIGGLGITAKSARNVITPLRSVLDDALNDEMIPYNPLDKIALKKLLTRTSIKSTYEVDPFDAAEKDAILAAASGQARNLFQFAFWSGLRTSELIALEWGDIDWIHGTVRVQRAVVVKTEKGTKTEAGTRDVLLLPLAREALLAQKEFTFLEGKRIFHNPKHGKPWETDGQIRKSCWQRILKKAGVRYRNPYQTRHTYASTLLSANENPWWVAKQMGHVDVEMVFRHYGRWIPSKRGDQYQPQNDWSRPNGTQSAIDNEGSVGTLAA
ncbi:MAG TPA: site-specific integrase [Burkholderiaceae bacterium]